MSTFYLEVCDDIRGTRKPEPLIGRNSFIVGNSYSASSNANIRVASRSLADRQFSLSLDRVGWSIEHIGGATPTLLGGAPLQKAERKRIGPGASVTVAHHTFRLVREQAQANKPSGFKFGQGVRRTDADALARTAGDVHAELIKALKSMRGEVSSGDKVDGEYFAAAEREFLEGRLEELARDTVRGLGVDELELIVSGALHRRCAEMLVDADETRVSVQHGWQERGGEIVRAQAESFLQKMGVKMVRLSLADDLEVLEESYDTLYTRNQLGMDEGAKRAIVREMLIRTVSQIVFGLGPIQSLIDMDSISEIMVVSPEQIFIEKAGKLRELPYGFPNENALMLTIERIVDQAGRRIDQQSPLVDARLNDGSRVNAVIQPLALKGPNLTIRKFPSKPLTLRELQGFGSMTKAMLHFLEACVRAEMSIVVSGGTGSGKTTMLNALSEYIDPGERVVTIEDTAELQLLQEHVITLQARSAGVESKGAITIQDLVKNALRMRPDRIIVGECRGPEALDMLQAMNTGHEGSMTTAHANTPQEMMLRLEAMVQMGYKEMPSVAIRRQIASAVDIIVQVERNAIGRRTTYISEVVGLDEDTGKLIVEGIFSYRLFRRTDEELLRIVEEFEAGRNILDICADSKINKDSANRIYEAYGDYFLRGAKKPKNEILKSEDTLREKHIFTGYLPNRIEAIVRDGGFVWGGLSR